MLLTQPIDFRFRWLARWMKKCVAASRNGLMAAVSGTFMLHRICDKSLSFSTLAHFAIPPELRLLTSLGLLIKPKLISVNTP